MKPLICMDKAYDIAMKILRGTNVDEIVEQETELAEC
jgi:hypothetical protein